MNSPKLRNNQSGAVAMITVILLSFIFLVVTLGFLRLAINEQRSATDTDLNSRAYYAAESGIEDAKRVIANLYNDGDLSGEDEDRLNGDTCEMASTNGVPDPILSEELDTEITCQLIDFSPDDYLANLLVNKSIFVPLIPDDADPTEVTSVVIEWHENEVNGNDYTARAIELEPTLPTANCWHSNEGTDCDLRGTPYPAMLRAGLFSHPVGGVARERIENSISYLNPVNGTGEIPIDDFESSPAGVDVASNNANCDGTTYMCRLEITELGGNVNYLRLTALYQDANVRITIYGDNGQLLFSKVQAKIDVTAKAGDVIRRIEARLPLDSIDILPDEAISTADQLCKLIDITGPETALDRCN